MLVKLQTVIVGGTISSPKLVNLENYGNLFEVSIVLITDLAPSRPQAIL